jgi:hypothetical protein
MGVSKNGTTRGNIRHDASRDQLESARSTEVIPQIHLPTDCCGNNADGPHVEKQRIQTGMIKAGSPPPRPAPPPAARRPALSPKPRRPSTATGADFGRAETGTGADSGRAPPGAVTPPAL